ncbi:MAG: AMP-binding protein [Pseudomonadota bacterium]
MIPSAKSYCHRGGETPLLGETIPEHFAHIAEQFPEQEAVVSMHQQRRMSYREMVRGVDKLARGLLDIGFGKGARIGVWSTNNIEWLLLQMATARIGTILVNINPAYRPRELAYALQRSEVQGIFTIPSFRSSDYIAMLIELLPELKHSGPTKLNSKMFPFLQRVVIYDPAKNTETERPHRGFMLWQEVLQAGEDIEEGALDQITDSLDRDDPINIQYTSGTTGFPKAVVLTHHNILNNAWFSAQAMHLTEQDRLCVPVPFYHCFGMVLANLLSLSVGACLVLPSEHFDPLTVLQAIEAEQCTALHGVPTMFIAELEQPGFSGFNLSSLRTGIMAGAPCPPPLMKRVMEEMHCAEILIGYGETEASPLTHLTDPDDTLERRTGTVGRNLPHQEVKIVNIESGETVARGEVGEICFRGYHIMQGYYGDPETTRKALDEHGWLFSGDLGSMDAEGYVKITGRRKEMIIRGGENIYPREIEDLIFSHPKVAEVAVFGIPDEFYGEQVMAWIQLQAGSEIDADEIRDYCRERLAHFKIPKHIRFVDEFPMTVTGKLQKFRMREMALEKMQQQD